MKNIQGMNVTVLGLGYIGCVTGACLSDMGHNVTGVDRDDHKVRSILDGKAPFYEPGLEELVRKNVAAGRLSATTSTNDALQEQRCRTGLRRYAFREERQSGARSASRAVVSDIAACAPAVVEAATVVAIRSTVFPGTCEEIVLPVFRGDRVTLSPTPSSYARAWPFGILWSRRSWWSAAAIARRSKRSRNCTRLSASKACLVSLRTAEMIKYTCNAFHAVKISFANEVGALCSKLGIDGA